MRNCIVQFHVSAKSYRDPTYNNIGVNEQLFEYSVKSVKNYANKIDCDYQLINEKRIDWKHPTFERFDLFFNDDWWNKYSNILYLDTDLIVWPDAPDIFRMYADESSFKICTDRIALRRSPEWHKKNVRNSALDDFSGETLQQNRFNAGVFMLNRNSAQIMKSYLDYKKILLDDNQLLIYAMLKSRVPVIKMDWRFNKKNGILCWFGHAYGQQKFKVEQYGLLSKAKELFQ